MGPRLLDDTAPLLRKEARPFPGMFFFSCGRQMINLDEDVEITCRQRYDYD